MKVDPRESQKVTDLLARSVRAHTDDIGGAVVQTDNVTPERVVLPSHLDSGTVHFSPPRLFAGPPAADPQHKDDAIHSNHGPRADATPQQLRIFKSAVEFSSNADIVFFYDTYTRMVTATFRPGTTDIEGAVQTARKSIERLHQGDYLHGHPALLRGYRFKWTRSQEVGVQQCAQATGAAENQPKPSLPQRVGFKVLVDRVMSRSFRLSYDIKTRIVTVHPKAGTTADAVDLARRASQKVAQLASLEKFNTYDMIKAVVLCADPTPNPR